MRIVNHHLINQEKSSEKSEDIRKSLISPRAKHNLIKELQEAKSIYEELQDKGVSVESYLKGEDMSSDFVQTSARLLQLLETTGGEIPQDLYSEYARLSKLEENKNASKAELLSKAFLNGFETRAQASRLSAEDADIKFSRVKVEHYGSHDGQDDFRLKLNDGYLDFSEFKGVPYVNMLEVPQSQRRKGIASALIQKLQSLYPDKEINLGYLTPDGAEFVKSLPFHLVNNDEIISANARMREVQAKLDEYQKLSDEYDEKFDKNSITEKDRQEFLEKVSDWNELDRELRQLEEITWNKSENRRIFDIDEMRFSRAQGTPTDAEIKEANAQYKQIRDKYFNTPLWHKSPNGKESKLSEDQWVWVRTPFFKKWFGDWETLAIINEVENMPAMELKASQKTYSQKDIENLFLSFGEVKNIRNGLFVTFPSSSVGKIIRHKGLPVESVVENFDKLFSESILAIEEKEVLKDGHKTHSNYLGYEHYINKFSLGDDVYYIRFTVPVENAKHQTLKKGYIPRKVHSSRISEISIYNEGSQSKNRNTTTGTKEASFVDDKLSKFLNAVNKKNVSKVIDENGEPLVVYHNSRNAFSVFKREKIGSATDWGVFGRGFYFSPTPLDLYGWERYVVALSLKNPFIVDETNARKIVDEIESDRGESFTNRIRKQGYDGVIYRRSGEFSEIVVFDGNQIKALSNRQTYDYGKGWVDVPNTDNVGTYSENPDIRFSRKDLPKTRLRKLEASTPIKINSKDVSIRIGGDLKMRKADAYDLAQNFYGTYSNKDTGAKIVVSKRSFEELLRHDVEFNKREENYANVSFAHFMSISKIPEIIKNAIFIDSIDNENPKTQNKIKSFDYYLLGLNVDGKDYTLKMVVSNGQDGEKYYDHTLTKIEKGKLSQYLIQSLTRGRNTGDNLPFNTRDKRIFLLLQEENSKNFAEDEKNEIIPTMMVTMGSLPKDSHLATDTDFKMFAKKISDLTKSSVDENFMLVKYVFSGASQLLIKKAINESANRETAEKIRNLLKDRAREVQRAPRTGNIGDSEGGRPQGQLGHQDIQDSSGKKSLQSLYFDTVNAELPQRGLEDSSDTKHSFRQERDKCRWY